MILAIMHSYIHEQAMMDITPNSSSVIIAGDKCIIFLVLVVTARPFSGATLTHAAIWCSRGVCRAGNGASL